MEGKAKEKTQLEAEGQKEAVSTFSKTPTSSEDELNLQLDSNSKQHPAVRNNKGSCIVRGRIIGKERPVPKPRKSLHDSKTTALPPGASSEDKQIDNVETNKNKMENKTVPLFRSRNMSFKQAIDSDSDDEPETEEKYSECTAYTEPTEIRDETGTKDNHCDPDQSLTGLLPNKDSNDNVLSGSQTSVDIDSDVNSPPAVRPIRKAPSPPSRKDQKIIPVPARRHKIHKSSDDETATSSSTDCLFIYQGDSMDIPIPTLKAPAPPPSPDPISENKPPRPDRPNSMHLHENKKKLGHRPPQESLDDEEYLLPFDKKDDKVLGTPEQSPSPDVSGSVSPGSDDVLLPTKKPNSKRRSLTHFFVSVKDTISGFSNTSATRKSTGKSPVSDQPTKFYYSTVQLEDIAKSIELSKKMNDNFEIASDGSPAQTSHKNNQADTKVISQHDINYRSQQGVKTHQHVAQSINKNFPQNTQLGTKLKDRSDNIYKDHREMRSDQNIPQAVPRNIQTGTKLQIKPDIMPRNYGDLKSHPHAAQSVQNTKLKVKPDSIPNNHKELKSDLRHQGKFKSYLQNQGEVKCDPKIQHELISGQDNQQEVKSVPKNLGEIKCDSKMMDEVKPESYELPKAPPRIKKKQAAERVKSGIYTCMSANTRTEVEKHGASDNKRHVPNEDDDDDTNEYIYPDAPKSASTSDV